MTFSFTQIYVSCVMSASVTNLVMVVISMLHDEPPKCVPDQPFPLSMYLVMIGLGAGGLLGGLRVLREQAEEEAPHG